MSQPVKPDTRELLFKRETRVGELNPPIQTRVYRRLSDSKIVVEQSHFLKTAIQYLPYAVNELPQEDPTIAFAELERIITYFYDQAVRRGYPPNNSWLVSNTSYCSE